MILTMETLSQGARDLAEKLRAIIEEHSFTGGYRVTCSFGVATFRAGDNADSLLKRVDEQLYKAKERGRNCVVSGGE